MPVRYSYGIASALLVGGAAISLITGHPAGAQVAQNDASQVRSMVPRAGAPESFADLTEQLAPAVVNISTRQRITVNSGNPFAGTPFADLFGNRGGQPTTREAQSLGSGFIISPDGYVVTNNHVIQGAQEIRVVLADRREFPARLVLADPRSDLAVLRIDTSGERLPVLPIDEGEAHQVGDLVLAIGNPFGVGQTVTNGIISALNRTETGISDSSSFIQTDAAINPGNSGGALVDMDGDLIGINTAIFSRSGSSAGVGFAVPASMVSRVVESAVGGATTVVRPWLGLKTESVTNDIARSLGLTRPQGVLVTDVFENGPADRAGVREGDVITEVAGAAVNDSSGLTFRVGTLRPGESAALSILRDGREMALTARVEPPPARPARNETTFTERPFEGATVVNLSPAVADELGMDPFTARGVIVTSLTARGFAARGGFRPGDIVREVNGNEVETVADLQRALRGDGPWVIAIDRGGRRLTA